MKTIKELEDLKKNKMYSQSWINTLDEKIKSLKDVSKLIKKVIPKDHICKHIKELKARIEGT